MNILLWVLQILAAVLYAASGYMKVFMFEKISREVPSFGALPRGVWRVLGVMELVCVVGLIVPAGFHWRAGLAVLAAAVLAAESLVFVGVHVSYRERGSVAMCVLLGVLMACVAYGRWVLSPIA